MDATDRRSRVPDGIERLRTDPGLCAHCRRAEVVTSSRSAFLRCRGADLDPRLPRYPALPVRECFAHRPIEDDA